MSDRSQPARGDILSPIIAGGLFLYVGFGLGLVGISGNIVYDQSVAALVWAARVIGLGLLLVAVLNWRDIHWAATLNLILATLAALVCLLVGAIWLVFADMQGLLLILFGLWNAGVAGSAWRRRRARRGAAMSFDRP